MSLNNKIIKDMANLFERLRNFVYKYKIMKIKSSLKSIKKETLTLNLLEEEEEFTLLIKQTQNLKHVKSNFMDDQNHKNTWNNFTRFVLWGTVAIVCVLVLMAIFLL